MAMLSLIFVYLIGGITFPVLAFLLIVWLATKPTSTVSIADHDSPTRALSTDDYDDDLLKSSNPPVASGYFAVCREYVPAGVNGKPPERSSPAGDVQIAGSPSVYQSMYKSIFDRGRTATPSIDGYDKKDGRTKKARNVFFVALRHDHLLLFDTAEQLEVRHVISLLHHQIDIYAGGEDMSEGDMFIKRNCIRLKRPPLSEHFEPTSKPFFFFSENCSEKEDFYHALLAAQSASAVPDAPIGPMKYDPAHMLKLVQALHTSDADPHLKWLNALVGRLFLGLYRVQALEDLVKAKLTRKIDRVPKPALISSVTIQHVDIGDAAPVLSNIKLKELNIDEDMVLEADVRYSGGFRIQVAAVARIDLGQRFRAREVDLVLAVVLKRLSGHMQIKIKAPPSNRIWIAFDAMPSLELSIEPIVSTRQITYGVILRAIESRIREVLAETIVLPNWDDIPFLDTANTTQRGGIWRHETARSEAEHVEDIDDAASGQLETLTLPDMDKAQADAPLSSTLEHRSMSVPIVKESAIGQAVSRKAVRSAQHRDPEGRSSGLSMASIAANKALTVQSTRAATPVKIPKSMRSPSFAATATPVVSTDDARPSVLRSNSAEAMPKREAMDLIKDVKIRDEALSVLPGPQAASHEDMSTRAKITAPEQQSVQSGDDSLASSVASSHGKDGLPTESSTPTMTRTHSQASSKKVSTTSLASTLTSSTAAAKQWGWNVINRQSTNKSVDSPSSSPQRNLVMPGETSRPATASASFAKTFAHMRGTAASSAEVRSGDSAREPMGRGQPLPAPGMPLPGPQKPTWGTVALNLVSKKKGSGAGQGVAAGVVSGSVAGAAVSVDPTIGVGARASQSSLASSDAPSVTRKAVRSDAGEEEMDAVQSSPGPKLPARATMAASYIGQAADEGMDDVSTYEDQGILATPWSATDTADNRATDPDHREIPEATSVNPTHHPVIEHEIQTVNDTRDSTSERTSANEGARARIDSENDIRIEPASILLSSSENVHVDSADPIKHPF